MAGIGTALGAEAPEGVPGLVVALVVARAQAAGARVAAPDAEAIVAPAGPVGQGGPGDSGGAGEPGVEAALGEGVADRVVVGSEVEVVAVRAAGRAPGRVVVGSEVEVVEAAGVDLRGVRLVGGPESLVARRAGLVRLHRAERVELTARRPRARGLDGVLARRAGRPVASRWARGPDPAGLVVRGGRVAGVVGLPGIVVGFAGARDPGQGRARC